MLKDTAKIVLLTGAGFTKNFGGFLASEMWSRIFNQPDIQALPRIRELLINDQDFESVYTKVLTGNFSPAEKEKTEQAVLAAYVRLDHQIKDWVFNSSNPLTFNTYANSGLGCLLALLNIESGRTGMWFTLNQDILVERRWNHRSPGAPTFKSHLYDMQGVTFSQSDFVSLTDDVDLKNRVYETIRGTAGVVYIKLHGSYGWRSPDGRSQIVLGHNKVDDIEKELLLKIYSEIFTETLLQGGKRMLVIGYGFGDEHINHVIERGIRENGLKIYVIGASSFTNFKERVADKYPHLLDGLIGYCDTPFQRLFPSNQGAKTAELEEILNAMKQ